MYAEAKEVYDRSKMEDKPSGKIYELIRTNTFKIAREKIEAAKRKEQESSQ